MRNTSSIPAKQAKRTPFFPAKFTTAAAKSPSSPRKPPNEEIEKTHFIYLIHSSKSTFQIKQIHSQLIRHSFFQDSRIGTQLISSCSLHKDIQYGLKIFSSICRPNLFIFNALIRGLVGNCYFYKSIDYFKVMLRVGVRPNRMTFPFVIKGIVGLDEKWVGGMVHGGILKMGLEFDSFVRVSLVDMYVNIGIFYFALKLFDESPERNKVESVILWNVVIKGCCKNGILEKAVELFEAMPERNLGSWNSLIDGLMRNGKVEKAVEYFERMVEKDVVSWTSMVHGLSLNGMYEKALELFFRMVEVVGERGNDRTLVSALSASGKVGALEAGIKIHNYIVHNGFRLNAALGNALVDMYGKCGQIQSASIVFNQMKEKDIRTWSIMIWSWAIHGCFKEAVQCFQKMKLAGIKPDEVTLLCILTACSHTGRVDQGLQFFNAMKLDYSIEPSMKHYAVIVDLLGRAGQLNEALNFIERMPIDPDHVIWGALFSACRAPKNIEMAKHVSGKLLRLQPEHSGSYVFISNIYAGIGRWEDVEKVRISMKDRGADKNPGWSYIEVDGKVHSFVAGDQAHKHTKEIYSKLEEMITRSRELGYIPESEWVLHNIEEEEKEDALGSHSEKLALAFGIISTGPGVVLRIVKNLRICGDCHSLMKYISTLSQREIVVRDKKRFHHFKDGGCSCQDYW